MPDLFLFLFCGLRCIAISSEKVVFLKKKVDCTWKRLLKTVISPWLCLHNCFLKVRVRYLLNLLYLKFSWALIDILKLILNFAENISPWKISKCFLFCIFLCNARPVLRSLQSQGFANQSLLNLALFPLMLSSNHQSIFILICFFFFCLCITRRQILFHTYLFVNNSFSVGGTEI